MDTIGERLAYIIKENNSNPNRIGKELDIHPSTVKNYLDNKTAPHSLILDKISNHFNISNEWLKTGKGDMNAIDSKINESNRNQDALRFTGMIKQYIPDEMQIIVKKLEAEIVDLYEYKELYLKAKEAYKPK